MLEMPNDTDFARRTMREVSTKLAENFNDPHTRHATSADSTGDSSREERQALRPSTFRLTFWRDHKNRYCLAVCKRHSSKDTCIGSYNDLSLAKAKRLALVLTTIMQELGVNVLVRWEDSVTRQALPAQAKAYLQESTNGHTHT